MFDALKWRLVGPHRGGRVVAVAGDPRESMTFYFGACAGGVFKSTDGGASWQNVSDGYFSTGAVGALAVAESDPNVIYAGMGEACIRADVSHGDGVYKSVDAGKTWRHLGLAETYHIGRVRIHPANPDIVYVAAFGHAYGPNPERGIFRSTDGGKTWDHKLFVDDRTGAIDLAMDPTNPRILYAALWQAQRTPYSLTSGGEGSGIYKSTDGGESWTPLNDRPGLPGGIKGRIGITVSPANHNRVWAAIEAQDGGFFRSEDGGETWVLASTSREQLQRPWYFMHIFSDPQDPDTVYCLNLQTWKSIDAGKSFTRLPVPHGDDHDLWIDQRNPQRMILGNDGGAIVSFDGGESWSTQYNQPTAQLYDVTTDTRFPYRIYGSQQDNTTVSLPSRSDRGFISRLDFYPVGGHESGRIAVRPDNPDITYAGIYNGRITRYDHKTGQVQDITVWPEDGIGWAAKDVKYRINWTFPIALSPHDPNILYTAGNHVFRSNDEGNSWETISPDLTRNDISKLQSSGGPITPDNYNTEQYCTIFSLAESPLAPGLLWAGSDDGLVHVSRDGGGHWQNVTPPDLPEWALISWVEPSPHDANSAYIAATRYKLDDFHPYLFKTSDLGKSWKLITNGIPIGEFTRAIKADPVRPSLLCVATEQGIHASFDDGESWQSLQLNLPVCPIYGLTIKDTDLTVATHGRSFWTLDDITPLREFKPKLASGEVRLCSPRPAYRFRQTSSYLSGGELNRKTHVAAGGDLVTTAYTRRDNNGDTYLEPIDAGTNPPDGVIVSYYLGQEPNDPLTLTFRDSSGNPIKQFSAQRDTRRSDAGSSPSQNSGLNRFVWDMRYPDPHPLENGRVFNYWARTPRGPVAPPGTYQVELLVDGRSYSETFEIWKDKRISTDEDALRRQFDLLLQIRDVFSDVNDATNVIYRLRSRVGQWLEWIRDDPGHAELADELHLVDDRLREVGMHLWQERIQIGSEFAKYPPQINSKLLSLSSYISGSETAPTTQSYAVFQALGDDADRHIEALHALINTDLRRINDKISKEDVAAISSWIQDVANG